MLIFAALSLKVPKYINTVQISAIADVDWSSSAKLFLCNQRQVAMLQQNFTSNQLPDKIIPSSVTVKKFRYQQGIIAKIKAVNIEMKMAGVAKAKRNTCC